MCAVKVTRNKLQPITAWKTAAAHGCDMALLADNLAMTPPQRIQAHRNALALVERLQAAGEKTRERS